MTGEHIIIDIIEIENKEILKYSKIIIEILNKIVEKYKLNVVGEAIYQFEPYGVTGIYILSESHLSIHTYVEEGKVAIDLYSCSKLNNLEDLEDFFKKII